MSAGTLLGYLDRWSVFPGETVVCRASAVDGDDFNAELVRIIQGDRHPQSPGYREERIDLDLGGPFAAGSQPLETGSLAIVETVSGTRHAGIVQRGRRHLADDSGSRRAGAVLPSRP
ncbi:MAG: hypothetical protein M5U09_11775 [Gammaproteobacteria bacterium]|nr:hypothetical protein [Gammaproteobacteria bacterium]